MDSKFLIVIPAYNSEPSLGQLIDEIERILVGLMHEILVVNDGSTDRTEKVASEKKVVVVSHVNNRGKGAALKTGFQYAVGHAIPYIVTMDADLQHDPSVLSEMIKYFMEHDFDILIGARKRDKQMSRDRALSNAITSWLISIRAGTKIIDSQSGYRILKTAFVKGLHLATNGYETESELIIRGARKNCRFGFFPVPTIYGNEASHIRRWRDTWRFVRMYFRTFFN